VKWYSRSPEQSPPLGLHLKWKKENWEKLFYDALDKEDRKKSDDMVDLLNVMLSDLLYQNWDNCEENRANQGTKILGYSFSVASGTSIDGLSQSSEKPCTFPVAISSTTKCIRKDAICTSNPDPVFE
jgi:hypothetical protein